MKAIQIQENGGPEVLKLVDLPTPEPGPGQVLIRVKGTSVNYADIKARQGRYHGAPPLPFIPGLDVLGQIVAIHPDSPPVFSEGQWVVAFPRTGSYAEYTVADIAHTFALPPGVSHDQAQAALLVGVTADQVLRVKGGLAPGDSVLIHSAAGGVGSTAVKLAHIYGAGKIWGSIGREEKRAWVEQLGVDGVFIYRGRTYADDLLAQSGGRGVNVILNGLGGGTLSEDMRCLAPLGRLVVFGDTLGPNLIAPTALYPTNRSVIGFSFGHLRRERPDQVAAMVAPVMDLLQSGQLSVTISERFSLDEARLAHDLMDRGQTVGKILIDVAELT